MHDLMLFFHRRGAKTKKEPSNAHGYVQRTSAQAKPLFPKSKIPMELLLLVIEQLWRDPTLKHRHLAYRNISLTSRDARAIIQELAIRHVVCTTKMDTGIYLSLAQKLNAASVLPLPASIDIRVSSLCLVPLVSMRVYLEDKYLLTKLLLKLSDKTDPERSSLFQDAQSLIISGEAFGNVHLAWIEQAPSLKHVFLDNFALNQAIFDFAPRESSTRYINLRITHLAVRMASFGRLDNTEDNPLNRLFPNVTTFELYGLFDLNQIHPNFYPPQMTTLVLHAPPDAAHTLVHPWNATVALKNDVFRRSTRSKLRIIFDVENQKLLGWKKMVSLAVQKGITLHQSSGCGCSPYCS
jgi:hypothetical protein